MGVLYKDISISKNTLLTGEEFTIAVNAIDVAAEAVAYRLSFKLGDPHGYPVCAIAPKAKTRITRLNFKLGAYKEDTLNPPPPKEVTPPQAVTIIERIPFRLGAYKEDYKNG